MYAMTGKLFAQPGKTDALAGILLRASELVSGMPGCHAYIVMADVKDASAIWVFEMWKDKESHDASLKDEQVRSLIAEAMPMMGGAPEGSELKILGGYGISE
jgi:quinol monooxygenase YgiN